MNQNELKCEMDRLMKESVPDLVKSHVQLEERIDQACMVILEYGMTDGAHHKQWVLDQVLRKLHPKGYEFLVDVNDWDVGIPP